MRAAKWSWRHICTTGKWLDRKKIKAALFDLYCVASYSQLVRIRAHENSLDSRNTARSAAEIWCDSEEQLGVRIPGDWEAELTAWRNLCASSNFSVVKQFRQTETESVFLAKYARARRILDRVPADAWLEPTALGNLLAALDEYGQARYSIDTGSLWSRIEQLATKEQRSAVRSAQLNLESAANLTAAFFITAFIPGVSQFTSGARLAGWIFPL